mmetsp:Transcript_20667/g.69108  ORF Transcript_20667/g.69108 Transcript_20667/m.69108 type:complete len:174 (+) Transcript_20667:212-733(+)
METLYVDRRPNASTRRNLTISVVTGMIVVVSCVVLLRGNARASQAPDVASMYHMWLAPNGLPLSPRKQRALLFQFCTTNFVTEAEMRYCYARLLSVGNPSGPVKFAGQPQYDSEQVVSPLFTFSAPPMDGGKGGGGDGGGSSDGAKKQIGKVTELASRPRMSEVLPSPSSLRG